MSDNSIVDHFEMRSTVYNEHCGFVKNEKLLRDIGNAISFNGDVLSILDLGAGTGAVSSYLADLFNERAKIYALDISKEMLEKIADPSIIRTVGSAEYIPFDNGFFDCVVSRQCLHYIEDIDRTIEEISRVLKTDGVFVLSQIVPIENECKQYWIDFSKFRQPLRKTFYSEINWINVFSKHRFRLRSVSNHSHQGSMKRWINQYKITNENDIDTYRSLLLNSSNLFKETYGIRVLEDDVLNIAYWSTMVFEKY